MNLARECTEFQRISISVPLVGATLIQIALGEAQLQFDFDTQGHGIWVEGRWELLNGHGEVIDAAKPNLDRTEYRILRPTSLIIRRTHMYLGLFLFPWMLMYALSTMVMNHRALFVATYGAGPPAYEKER